MKRISPPFYTNSLSLASAVKRYFALKINPSVLNSFKMIFMMKGFRLTHISTLKGEHSRCDVICEISEIRDMTD